MSKDGISDLEDDDNDTSSLGCSELEGILGEGTGMHALSTRSASLLAQQAMGRIGLPVMGSRGVLQ